MRLRLSRERSGVRRDSPPPPGRAGPPRRWRRCPATSPRLGHCLSHLAEDEKRKTREDGTGDGGGSGRGERGGGVGRDQGGRQAENGNRSKKCRWTLAARAGVGWWGLLFRARGDAIPLNITSSEQDLLQLLVCTYVHHIQISQVSLNITNLLAEIPTAGLPISCTLGPC